MERSSLIVGAAEVVGGGTMDGWGGMGLGRMDGWGDRGRCVMGLGNYGEGPAIAIGQKFQNVENEEKMK